MGYLITGSGGAVTFQALSDTPPSYVGQAAKLIAVNSTEDAVEFVVPPIQLSIVEITAADSPYAASVGEAVIVDASAGDVSVDLPNAAASDGFIYVKRIDAASTLVDIASVNSVAVDDSTSPIYINPKSALMFVPVSSSDKWWSL